MRWRLEPYVFLHGGRPSRDLGWRRGREIGKGMMGNMYDMMGNGIDERQRLNGSFFFLSFFLRRNGHTLVLDRSLFFFSINGSRSDR